MTQPYQAIPTCDVDLKRLKAVGILKILDDAVAAHGDFVRLRFSASDELLVLAAARHVRLWQQQADAFGKEVSRLPSSSAVGRVLLGDALTFAEDGDEWRHGRRLTMPLVSPKLEALQQSMSNSAGWLAERFASEEPLLLRDMTTEWAVRVVLPPFMGQRFTIEEGKRFATQTHQAFFSLIKKAASCDRETLLADPELHAYRQLLSEMTDRGIAGIANEPDTMLAGLYHAMEVAQYPARKGSLTNLVMGNLSGSIDNPATSLQWCLIHLAQHPDVQARIRAEALQQPAGCTVMQKFPVTLAAVRECLRLTPVSSLVERTLRQPLVIDGCSVPEGTNVLFSPWRVHRDPSLWQDPLRFDISRFMQGSIPPHHYFPFGTGKRNCVGMTLSLNQLVLSLARLSLSYRYRLAESTRAVDLRPEFGLNLAPRGNVRLIAEPVVERESVCSV